MSKTEVGHVLERIGKQSPSGFAIALHVKFTSPKYLFQSYSPEWMDTYSRKGFVLCDPTVGWGFENTGTIRWSSLSDQDTEGVLSLAAEHGLNYGFTTSLLIDDSRSISSFARPDQEFSDEEIDQITQDVELLHKETLGVESLSPEDHAALKRMSVMLVNGG